ncbi:hypothetical protein [Gorillibacterium sp. CAU 1737]|uniref:hypothetical protein n=1 Tax=Gorillibacterium sp. CAU 1737 TaxID=3140362 RepID=UPI0032611495
MSRIRKIITLIVVGLILSSCSKQVDYSDSYQPETDYPIRFQQQASNTRIVPSEAGYYILNANYLYYADKSSMEPVLLDNRPDNQCLQPDQTDPALHCSAYVNIPDTYGFLAYHKNKLYTLENQAIFKKDQVIAERTHLMQVAKDGSSRKKMFTFESLPVSIIVHRGNVYYALRDFDKDSNLRYEVRTFPLTSSSPKSKVIYKGQLPEGSIQGLTAYGKHLYFTEFAPNLTRVMHYDIQEKNLTRLFTDDDSVYPTLEDIADNQLVFGYFYGTLEDKRSWVVYSSNLDGSQIHKLPVDRTYLSIFSADDRYRYARPPWYYLDTDPFQSIPYEMTVYSPQYEELGKVDMTAFKKDHSLIMGDDTYMFVRYGQKGSQLVKILKKTEFPTRFPVFQDFLETPYRTEG